MTHLTVDASYTGHRGSPRPPQVRAALSPFELPRQVITYTRSIEHPEHPGAYRVIDNLSRFQSLSETTFGLPTSDPLNAFRVPHGLTKRLRPPFSTNRHGCSRVSLESFRSLIKSRGFRYVLTDGGRIKIAEWCPWGLFASPEVSHELTYGGLRWCWPNTARDVPVTPRWIALGVWIFLLDESDETPSAIAQ